MLSKIRDFRLDRVYSINASSHKFAMGVTSCGWCIWRSSEYLPHDLIFRDDFLGSDNVILSRTVISFT
jgi:glutamate decarboxylase